MCGIIGYSGNQNAGDIIIEGLHSLEYRGYDSAGMTIVTSNGITTIKCKGRVENLEEKYDKKSVNGQCGIGHTRWATHGIPSENNAHPHESEGCIIVHNGIIENYDILKKGLIKKGYLFKSDTDSECIAHLIDSIYKECHQPKLTIMRMLKHIEGSYAIAVIFKDRKDEIWAIKRNNPLVATEDEHGTYLASDIPALLPYSKSFIRPDDKQILLLNGHRVAIYNEQGDEIEKRYESVNWDNVTAQKDGYEHFMLKEIYEQPYAIIRAITPLITDDNFPDYNNITFSRECAQKIDSVSIIGCGSATHAGLVGKYVIEKLAKIPVYVTTASEYAYHPPISTKNGLTIAVSQSGETADTLTALKLAKQNGEKTLGIVNVVGSAISKLADSVIYTSAGPEIAVATTKGYTTQLAVFYMIGIALGYAKGTITDKQTAKYIKIIKDELPQKIIDVLNLRDRVKCLSQKLKECHDLYFIGRGLDSYSCVECSLKLKEISYIHSEAYPAGELKHGTLSLIEDGTTVVAVSTDDVYTKKILANIKEITSRGGKVIYVSDKDISSQFYNDLVLLPTLESMFSPFLTVIFAQLLSYETAVLRGCDVDHPRNLAKSVTVE